MVADVNVFVGQQRFLRLIDEETWATVPAVDPVWVDVPVTDYTVRNRPKRRNGQARTGSYQRRYGANPSGHPSGNLVTPLYGFVNEDLEISLAQLMMEWGFADHEVKFPRSKTAEWQYVGHDNDQRHLGLRVNTATLAGSEAGIVLTLELIGQSSVSFTGAASPPADRNKLVEFLFEDSTFTLGGTPLRVSQFQWSVQRNLDVIYHNSHNPISMPKTQFSETFSITPMKSNKTYDDLRDAFGMPELAGQLVLKGLHNGTGDTGNFTVLTIDFDRLSLIDSDESGGTGAIMNPLTFDVLKPDTADNGSAMTWTEAA
ncbi:phage tail tube protein [Schlesneria sp. DSM 10557]|uniref:phage tail tube protein n=1 Tax=Schlesneria sp. DSM 10557 TaxID=3044399 RepID=UPI0035A0A942